MISIQGVHLLVRIGGIKPYHINVVVIPYFYLYFLSGENESRHSQL